MGSVTYFFPVVVNDRDHEWMKALTEAKINFLLLTVWRETIFLWPAVSMSRIYKVKMEACQGICPSFFINPPAGKWGKL